MQRDLHIPLSACFCRLCCPFEPFSNQTESNNSWVRQSDTVKPKYICESLIVFNFSTQSNSSYHRSVGHPGYHFQTYTCNIHVPVSPLFSNKCSPGSTTEPNQTQMNIQLHSITPNVFSLNCV